MYDRSTSTTFFVVMLSLFVCTTTYAKAPTAPSPHTTAAQQKPVVQKTAIIAVRYVRGSRLLRLLRTFVPRHKLGTTDLRWSHALHKLMIRAEPDVMLLLKKAHQQLDVPHAQFRIQFFFLKPSTTPDKTIETHHPRLHRYVAAHYRAARHFHLTRHMYLRTHNHQRSELRFNGEGKVKDPSLRVQLHQAPNPKAKIVAEIKILRHEAFSTLGKHGLSTQFITATQLRTTVSVRPGRYSIVGYPVMRSRSILVMKIDRLSDVRPDKATPQKEKSWTWGKDAIRSVIRKNLAHFKRCYESALKQKPKLKGRVVVSFQIESQGHVNKAMIRSSSLKDKGVEACLQRRFFMLRFPAPPGGRKVKVNYPLNFSPN